MSFIRILTIASLFLIFTTQPSQPTQALTPADVAQVNCDTVTEIPTIECEALVALYNSTDGPNWDNHTDWLVTDTPCSWYGVECEAGNVSKLVLVGELGNPFGLKGALPAEIGDFSRLKSFQFYDNQLTSLPPEIGNLNNLIEIHLSGNQLTSLPPEIGDLNNLGYLYLDFNPLESLPDEIGNLTNLDYLFLIRNQLTTLPPQIGNLASLTNLRLQDNQLTSLPPEIGNLNNLIILRLSGNQLTTLPSQMGDLSSLEDLWLHNNQLTTLPTSFVNLTQITDLNLADNGLSVADAGLRSWMDTHDPDWADTNPDTAAPNATNTPATVATSTLAPTATPPANTATSTPVPAATNTPQSIATQVNTAQPTTVGTPAPTPTSGPQDSYEADGLCNSASRILTDGTLQERTFHASDDIDWVQFDAIADTEYRIEITTPDDSLADVIPELHPNCGTLPDDTTWTGTFGPGARLTHMATEDGPVYLRLANYDDTIYGPNVAYQLSVRAMSAEPQSRALIIVAGRLRQNDRLQNNIHNVTDRVYELFQQNGYTNDNIYYLATDADLTGYDAPASLENIRLAITQWADQLLDDEGVLTLYLMDHGHEDRLYIDGPRNEILTPGDLDQWLTTLETAKPNLLVNVFIEACHSGSFIEGEESISKSGRVVITSSDVQRVAYASRTGAYFSDYFLNGLWQGRDVFNSFQDARHNVTRLYAYQQPWIDANGNGIHNEPADETLAAQRGFAYAGTLSDDRWSPHIAQATGTLDPDANSGVIRATVRDDGRVENVWAVIYPPSYEPLVNETGELVQETLQTLNLLAQGEDQYAVEYAAFNEAGTYRILIHAEDNEGLVAHPEPLDIVVGGASLSGGGLVYLPVIRR